MTTTPVDPNSIVIPARTPILVCVSIGLTLFFACTIALNQMQSAPVLLLQLGQVAGILFNGAATWLSLSRGAAREARAAALKAQASERELESGNA